MSVWRYPFAWDAPCPQTPEEQPAGWCHTHGNGRYGLKQTLLPAPVRSGQCDPRPQLTEGVLCDLPRVFACVFPAVTLTLTPTLTLTQTLTLTPTQTPTLTPTLTPTQTLTLTLTPTLTLTLTLTRWWA